MELLQRFLTRSALINAGLVVLSLCLAPFLAEAALRLAVATHALSLTPPLSVALNGLPRALYHLDENGSPYYGGGYKVYLRDGVPLQRVNYNDSGFRPHDAERFESDRRKVGVFGDSYTEGLQVGEGETIPEQTETRLKELEGDGSPCVFNFGVGGTGTYQQYLRYRTVKRHVALDTVVVAFLPLNDVLNNHRELNRAFELPGSRYLARVGEGFAEMASAYTEASVQGAGLKSWISDHSYAASAVYQIWSNVQNAYLYQPGGARAAWVGVYGPPATPAWSDAWRSTEECILRMHAEVERDGARFVLLLLTDSVQIAPPAALASSAQLDYPNRRLAAFANAHGIPCVDTYDTFAAERKTMKPPYFSWPNDGHYSPLGAHLAGKLLADYLHSMAPQNGAARQK